MTNALTLKPAKLLATSQINGKTVSFFTPPHWEPDFLWVDIQELAAAFCSKDEAVILTNASHATAINGDRIATIICHSQAQGLCGAIDHMNGVDKDGPALNAYCLTASEVSLKHWRMDIDQLLLAFGNIGGPFMRSRA